MHFTCQGAAEHNILSDSLLQFPLYSWRRVPHSYKFHLNKFAMLGKLFLFFSVEKFHQSVMKIV